MAVSSPIDISPGAVVAPVTAVQKWAIFRYLTLVLITSFFLTTIRSGHSWGDDFAQYLQHATNIAHFRPYSESGYIYNPQNAIVGPRAYPPGYPASLAPVAALSGSNLHAFKIMNVLFFLVALIVVGRLFSHDLSGRSLWVCLTIIGFCPIYWEYKDAIASENLFIPLWYATIYVADDWYRRQRVYGSQTLHGVILGGLIFITCATRTVGVVLLPTVVVCEVMLARKVTRVGISSLLTAISLLVTEKMILPSSGAGYVEQLSGISLSSVIANTYSDTTAFSLIWQNRNWEGLRKIAGLAFVMLAVIGFLRTNLPRLTPLGIAVTGYFVLIVAWPSADGLRMVMPLLPAYLFYLLRVISNLLMTPTATKAGSLGLLCFSLFTYGAYYSRVDFERLANGVETTPAQELFDFVRNHTQPEEVSLFYKPRALAFYTGRRSSAFPLGADEQGFWQYANDIGANLIIVREGAGDIKSDDLTFEMNAPFSGPNIEEVFHNSMFHVYRWVPPAADNSEHNAI